MLPTPPFHKMKLQQILDKADFYQVKVLNVIEKAYSLCKPLYILVFLLGLHWFSTSGSVFNMINNAQPYGVTHGAHGEEKIQFLAGGTHNQYSTEGTVAGALTVAASFFFIRYLRSIHKDSSTLALVNVAIGIFFVTLIHVMYQLKNNRGGE